MILFVTTLLNMDMKDFSIPGYLFEHLLLYW